MTAPMAVNGPRLSLTADPPRRAFGAPAKPLPSLSSPGAFNGSTTPTGMSFLIPPAEPQRTLSASSSSSEALGTAANRAQAWLHTWAPKGEGRGREFLSNTLSGVAGVANTVGHGINGAVNNIGVQLSNENFGKDGREIAGMGSRQGSYTAPTSSSPTDEFSPLARAESWSPPLPMYSSSTPQLPLPDETPLPTAPLAASKRMSQPSNLSRLGSSTSSNAMYPPSPSILAVQRPSMSHPSSSTSLPSNIPRSSSISVNLALPQPHGPSHLNPNARSNSHLSAQTPSHSRSPSYGAMSPTLSRASSTTAGLSTSRSAGMPYKVGFQPAGVRNDRTGEFSEERRRYGEDRDKEEGRLGRRWAKLVDLHFNPTIPIPQQSGTNTLTRSSSSSMSLASTSDKRRSLLSIDGALDAFKPKEMWKGLSGVAAPANGPGGDEARKRAAEQAIVKWEDDAEAKKCRICQASFSLSTRKHHCRLCGRIVCSLPPTPPALLAVQIQLFSSAEPSASLPPGTRREKCSFLLVADWQTGRGEEVDEGFVGWMTMEDGEGNSPNGDGGDRKTAKREKRKSKSSIASSMERREEDRILPLPQQPKEVQVKGVRVCRECRDVVSRKQKIQDRQRVTGFARLYQMLRGLQAEIEEVLPEFEEQLDYLTSSDEARDPSHEAIAIHKHLLTLFAQYEHLSKRISNLPCEEGGSQAQVQSAVARSAAMFLGKEMGKVQTLPKIQKRAADARRKSMAIVETTVAEQLRSEGVQDEQAEDVAVALQPLLEQEAQLEVMIADANAQRKYEDGKALAEALGEIRLEIGRVTQRAIS